MKINNFEDLLVWQKARELANSIYKTTNKFPASEKYNLTDQMRRCAVSVMANIAEGFSRYYLSETLMFYRNARGSLSELKSHLYICFDQDMVDKKTLYNYVDIIDETGRMLNGLINTTHNFRGKSKLTSKL